MKITFFYSLTFEVNLSINCRRGRHCSPLLFVFLPQISGPSFLESRLRLHSVLILESLETADESRPV